MILIIMLSFMLLIGYAFITCLKYDDIDSIGWFFTGFSSVFLVISIVIIIISHIRADNVIQQNKIQYAELCKKYEIAKSEYEDVSKSDVINDITEWNTKVYITKYRTEDPLTNWYNPKKVADNLEYISLDE